MYLKEILKSLKNDPGMLMMRMEVMIEKYALAPIGLNNTTVKIFMVLISKGRVYQKEIVDFVATTPANVSRRLEIMKKEGLIERAIEGDNGDRRKVLISITDKGTRKFTEAIHRVSVIKTFIGDKFTKKELEERKKFNQKLKGAIDELETKIEDFYK